jgi:hypothetical protein
MIISVVVFMVATTYHCSAQPSIRFLMVKTISPDELKQKIDPQGQLSACRDIDRCDLSSATLPERHLPLERMMELATTVLPNKGAACF